MSKKKSWVGPALLIGGGAATAGAIWFASRKSDETVDDVEAAIRGGTMSDGTPASKKPIKVHLTGYWPFAAREDEKKMEGGVADRRGKPLHTLEQHLKDPVAHPYVSVAGDDAIWPYGQRLSISAWPNAVFRVVDTGGHFRGAGKIYRVLGNEPLDICVDSSKTVVPKSGTTATIYPGDNFEKGKAVAVSKIKDQDIPA